jgi:hypothetical protein
MAPRLPHRTTIKERLEDAAATPRWNDALSEDLAAMHAHGASVSWHSTDIDSNAIEAEVMAGAVRRSRPG